MKSEQIARVCYEFVRCFDDTMITPWEELSPESRSTLVKHVMYVVHEIDGGEAATFTEPYGAMLRSVVGAFFEEFRKMPVGMIEIGGMLPSDLLDYTTTRFKDKERITVYPKDLE